MRMSKLSISYKSVASVTLVVIGLSLSAQNSIGKRPLIPLSVFEYFQERDFKSVISLLDNKSILSPDEQILYAVSGMKTGENDAVREVKKWIDSYPNHAMQSLAKFHYAANSYQKGDTIISANYLSEVKFDELSKPDRAEYGFVYGLLNLQKKPAITTN